MGWVDPTGLFRGDPGAYMRLVIDVVAKDARKPGRATPWGRIWTVGFAVGASGAATYLYFRDGGGCGGGDENDWNDGDDDNSDRCWKRYYAEEARCFSRWAKNPSQKFPCVQRAKERRDACLKGNPDPNNEWSFNDIF